jgi:proteasome lid subunit RPN8/RPN11
MAALTIPQYIFDKMIAHCRSGYPDEACGILAGKDGRVQKIYEMTNVEPSPVSYFMDPKEQFEAMKNMRLEGLKMLAIYHSHPFSPAYPSAKDVSLAFYSDALYIIVGPADKDNPDVKAFRISEGRVEKEEFTILE